MWIRSLENKQEGAKIRFLGSAAREVLELEKAVMFTEIRCYRRLETLQKRESVTEESRF